MTLKERIIHNSVAQLGGQFVLYGLGMVASILTMRYLGPEAFGKYSFIMVYVGVVSLFNDFGGQTLLARELSQNPGQEGKILGNYMLLKLPFSLIITGISIGLLFMLGYSPDISFYTIIALLTIPLGTPSLLSVIFQTKLKIWYIAVVNVVIRILSLVLIGVMVIYNGGIEILIFGLLGVTIITTPLMVWLSAREIRPDFRLDVKLIKRLVTDTIPLGFMIILGSLVLKLDTLLLSKLADIRAVGLYNSAYKFVDWELTLMVGLLISHLPLFSSLVHREPEKTRRLFQKTLEIVEFLFIPAAVFGLFASKQILLLTSGQKYLESSLALSVLLWVPVFNAFNFITYNILIALRLQTTTLIIYSVVVVVNIAINLWGIPRYGFNTCAFASLVSELVAFGPMLYYLIVKAGIRPKTRKLLSILIASVTGVLPGIIFPQMGIWSNMLLFGFIYLLLSLVTGVFTKEEIIRGWNLLHNKYLKAGTK